MSKQLNLPPQCLIYLHNPLFRSLRWILRRTQDQVLSNLSQKRTLPIVMLRIHIFLAKEWWAWTKEGIEDLVYWKPCLLLNTYHPQPQKRKERKSQLDFKRKQSFLKNDLFVVLESRGRKILLMQINVYLSLM